MSNLSVVLVFTVALGGYSVGCWGFSGSSPSFNPLHVVVDCGAEEIAAPPMWFGTNTSSISRLACTTSTCDVDWPFA